MIGIDNVCVMPKVQDCITKSKKENNEALAGLPEGELQKLLEEAVTFNRPSSEDSYLLQKLKAEHAELCKDVRQHSTSLNPEVSSSSFDTFSQAGVSGEASKRRDVCVSKFFHDPNTCRDIIRSVDLVEQRTGFSGRNNEDYSTFVSGSKQHESKSSVDLTFMKTLDSCVMMQPLEKDKGNKDYRAKHTNSLSDSPSEASFHKDDTFQITRTNGLSFEIISSSLDPMNIRSNILKDQFSAIDLHKKSVYISSHLSDLVSHELLDFSKLIDSSYLGVKQKPCHQNSFTDTQQKMDTTTNLVSSSEYMQDLKNSYNRPVDFEMKEMKKTKCMEEAINETSMLKRFLSVCNNHYAGCKSDGDKEDIQFDKVKVNENTAVLPKVFDCDAENPLSREVQSETVYVQPQIRNLRLRPLCSKLNEEMGFSPLELSGSSKTEIFSTEARNLQNDRANRKGKRLRGNTDTQTILFAKDIAGHRWDEDIDSLLAFINSSDQKLEGVAVESINSLENVDSLPRSSVHQVRDRKKYKVSSKEGKNGPNCKPKTNYEKSSKDHRNYVSSRDEANENLSDCIDQIQEQKSQDEASRKPKTCGTSFGNFNLERIPKSKSLDSTSSFFAESSFECEQQDRIKTCVTDSNTIINNSNESEAVLIHNNIPSGFVKDFYSVTEVAHDYVEETEFRVVMKKKKHKNKHLPKKSFDISRKYNHTSGIKKQYPDKLTEQASCNELVLKLPIQPRGRQDGSHQKSSSSVPPSEHSSSENSDLDSVHSLPVGGSGPLPTYVYPHTTPSSSSSTPQASYADIARMSVNSSEPKSRLYSSLTDRDLKSGISLPPLQKNFGLEFGVDSTLFENDHCLISNNQPHTITEEDCISSGVAGIACSKGNLHSKYSNLHNSVISQTDLIMNNGNSHVLEGNPDLSNQITTEEPITSISTGANELVISNEPETLESGQEKVAAIDLGQQTQNRSECPPVIILDNYIPKDSVCDISFGFEVNEQLLCMTLGNNYSKVMKRLNSDLQIPPTVFTAIPGNVVSSLSFSPVVPPDTNVNTELCEDLKHSLFNKVVTRSGHFMKWQEPTVDTDTFNYNQIVNFFGLTWKKALKDYQQGSENSTKASKVRFYTEQ